MVHIDIKTVLQILQDELNMQKACANMVPENLCHELKDARIHIGIGLLERFAAETNVLENITTCDKAWIFLA